MLTPSTKAETTAFFFSTPSLFMPQVYLLARIVSNSFLQVFDLFLLAGIIMAATRVIREKGDCMVDRTKDPLREQAAKGGRARARSLTKERRSEIAREAVEARWRREGLLNEIPNATHDGTIKIGDGTIEIPCAVLSDGTRVISQRGFAKGLGAGKPMSMTRRGAGELPAFLNAANLKPFIPNDLSTPANFVVYRAKGGQRAFGIKATAIPEICNVWLKARDAGVLKHSQEHLAVRADLIMRGLAHVGIVALVDEATGFQDDRARDALAKILEAFVAKELRAWVHTFPVDYYKQLYRLRSLEYPPKGNKMPQYFGRLTNDIVYQRLAPGVLDELRRLTPRDEKGRPKHRYHQRLTGDIGHPKLLQHLGAVVAVMRFAEDGNYDGFLKMLDKHYPRQTKLPLFEGQDDSQLDGEQSPSGSS